MGKRLSGERFRHHPGRAAAGLIVTISTVTLAAASGWLALAVLVPLAWTVWLWRAGTEVDEDGFRVRALLGSRRIPWSDVRELTPDRRGGVVATLTTGVTIRLTAVSLADLPRMAAASGQQLTRSDGGESAGQEPTHSDAPATDSR